MSMLYIAVSLLGTPPRLEIDSINFSKCEEKGGDKQPVPFSFLTDRVWIDVSRFIYMSWISTNH